MKYIIEKGNHYSNFKLTKLQPFSKSTITGRVKFSDSCIIKSDPDGWNKLIGISSLFIHKNSGRLVFRGNGEQILIAAYVYNDGVRSEHQLLKVKPNIWYSFKISYDNGEWFFFMHNQAITMDGNLGCLKFKCHPYYGGLDVAHERTIIEFDRY